MFRRRTTNIILSTVILLILLLSSCSKTKNSGKIATTEIQRDAITYWYIYSYETNEKTDSLKTLASGFEQSLKLYTKESDTICKNVNNIVFFCVFNLYDSKFAIIMDTNTCIYRLENNSYYKILNISCPVGWNDVTMIKSDFNADNFTDIILKVPTGGWNGDEYLFLFYCPEKKTFLYDPFTRLYDVSIDAKNNTVTSYQHRCAPVTYKIEKYSFQQLK